MGSLTVSDEATFCHKKHMWEVTWEVMQYCAGGEEFLFLNGFP